MTFPQLPLPARYSRLIFLLGLPLFISFGLLTSCTPGTSSSSSNAPDSADPQTAAALSRAASSDSDVHASSQKDARSVAQKLTDASTEARIKQALMRDRALRGSQFRPLVLRGHLILRGDVNTPSQYQKAERIGASVEGVKDVTNELTIGGRSPTEKRSASSSQPNATDETQAVYHTVRQGDTLWDIARQYRASVQKIRNLNDLQASSLRPGERIRVR